MGAYPARANARVSSQPTTRNGHVMINLPENSQGSSSGTEKLELEGYDEDWHLMLSNIIQLAKGEPLAGVLGNFASDSASTMDDLKKIIGDNPGVAKLSISGDAFGLPSKTTLVFDDNRVCESHIELDLDDGAELEKSDLAEVLTRAVAALCYLAKAPVAFGSDGDDALKLTATWALYGVEITLESRPESTPPISIRMLSPPANWSGYVDTLLAA